MGTARIALLGPLTVDGGGVSLGPRDRVVLTALATRFGQAVSADELADALWGDTPPDSWSKVVAGCVMRLRRALGATAIETTPHGYRLAVLADDLDLCRFEQSVRRGRELLALGETERAAFVVGEGLALWRGRPLADAERWEPTHVAVTRLEQVRLDAEELRVEAYLRSGNHREVVADAQALVTHAPLREHRWALLAQVHYQAGRQGDALRTLRQARSVLASELGVDPGPELVELEQAILRQDPKLISDTAPAAPSGSCPYPGLAPFDVGDADGFFGRDLEIAECLRRLGTHGAVVVAGPSGSGKSSLVRAGVAAALERDGQRVVVITPGSRPIDELGAIRHDGDVLVVDQCEEVLSLGADVGTQLRFFAALAEHAQRSRLVVSLRADRLADITSSAPFARVVERGLYLLAAMGEAQLREAIEGPARQAGLLLEPGLVDLLVREVEGEPGALPLLSHALRRTWERREGRTLTVAGYRAAGGIRGAVAQTAEELYEAVAPDVRPLLRDVLLRLVVPGADGEPIRLRVPTQSLAIDTERTQLLERLAAARLVTVDGDRVEIAHEALIGAWPRLRGWLDDDVEGRRIFGHLVAAAETWDQMGRPESELYRGVRLTQALAWQDQASADLTPTEREFLAAGGRHAEHELHRHRRTNRRLKGLVVALSLVLVGAVVAGALAIGQRRRAEAESNVAEARRVAAQALVEWPYDRALLLAVEAVRLWDSAETRGTVLSVIERSPRATGVIHSGGPRLVDLVVSPDGSHAVTIDHREVLTLYDLEARRAVATLTSDGTSYRAPAFSPDGTRIAVSRFPTSCWFGEGCETSSIDLLDARDLSPLGVSYRGGLAVPAMDVAFSPTGDRLAGVAPLVFAGAVDNVAVWEVDDPDAPPTLLSVPEPGVDRRPVPESAVPGWLRFAPDGSEIYAGGAGPAFAIGVGDADPRREFDGDGALALSPDGASIAVLTTPTTVGVFHTGDGRRRAELVGHDGLVVAAAFSPDGRQLATVSNDETVAVWDVASGRRRQLLEGHVGGVLAVDFAADGTLYTAGADGSIVRWDVEGVGGVARQLSGPRLAVGGAGSIWISPSAERVAVPALGGLVLIELGGASSKLSLDDLAWAAFSPDSERLVAVDRDGALGLWSAEDGSQLASRPGREVSNFGAVTFTADGSAVLVADGDGSVIELDGQSLEPTGRSLDVGGEPGGIRAAADGTIAVVSSIDNEDRLEVVFADLDDGRITRRMELAMSTGFSSFAPDASAFAVGGFDGRLTIVDLVHGTARGPSDPVHSGAVGAVAFSPDGATLASLGVDGELVLVDTATGAVTARIRPGPASLVSTVVYRADGTSVVLAYEDGSAIEVATDPAMWIDHACQVAGRDLTDHEWRSVFGDGRARRASCGDAERDG